MPLHDGAGGGVDIDACIALLEAHGVPLDPGLQPAELAEIEARYGFVFSPDHRHLLARVQPAGERWLHWTRDSEDSIGSRLDWPREGVLFDVENNAFWPAGWGVRPPNAEARSAVATERVGQWPTLVPLFAHRYMPAAPAGPGAPVFSVWQTDVVFSGADLLDCLRRELEPDTAGSLVIDVSADSCVPWSLFPFEQEVAE